jgi:hypothetical protein
MLVATILTFDASRKKTRAGASQQPACEHKQVTASTVSRSVRCTFCGIELDPFDVLLDMLKAYVPADTGREELRLQKEVEKRSADKNSSDPTSTY